VGLVKAPGPIAHVLHLLVAFVAMAKVRLVSSRLTLSYMCISINEGLPRRMLLYQLQKGRRRMLLLDFFLHDLRSKEEGRTVASLKTFPSGTKSGRDIVNLGHRCSYSQQNVQ
jgi:hypothetical protein